MHGMVIFRMELSFSLDENANSNMFKVPAIPNATSTPNKKKNATKRLVCPVCQKVYQLQHYYNLHLSTHTSSERTNSTQGQYSGLGRNRLWCYTNLVM